MRHFLLKRQVGYIKLHIKFKRLTALDIIFSIQWQMKNQIDFKNELCMFAEHTGLVLIFLSFCSNWYLVLTNCLTSLADDQRSWTNQSIVCLIYMYIWSFATNNLVNRTLMAKRRSGIWIGKHLLQWCCLSKEDLLIDPINSSHLSPLPDMAVTLWQN